MLFRNALTKTQKEWVFKLVDNIVLRARYSAEKYRQLAKMCHDGSNEGIVENNPLLECGYANEKIYYKVK